MHLAILLTINIACTVINAVSVTYLIINHARNRQKEAQAEQDLARIQLESLKN